MLSHLHGCPRERQETFTWEGATVTRCIDCGVQIVERQEAEQSDDGVRFEATPPPTFREVHL